MTADPEPFATRTSPAALADLRARLANTRWPDAPDGAGWSLGADVDDLRTLVSFWADEFDWETVERSLNRLPRYTLDVDGRQIHFLHLRAASTSGPTLPLLLCHGWPDSFWRYVKVAPLLADPGAHGVDPTVAFDVVIPDMPGFGYSPPARDTVLNSIDVADLWARLMDLLGYPRFAVAGGDIGSHVSRYLALNHPDRVVAVHRTDAGVPVFFGDRSELASEEIAWLDAGATWAVAEGAYGAMHRTKPQTAGVGLTDSPAGLAAWIVEKMRSWSDCEGDVERSFTKTEMLTNLTIYWLTGSIASSMRMYHANALIPPSQLARRVEVPSGFSLFPHDLLVPPTAWLERTAHTVYVNRLTRGGHFAPFEEPELYATELRNFLHPFRPPP